jgi:hypothetical protein
MVRFIIICVYFFISFLGKAQVIENYENDWIIEKSSFLLKKKTRINLLLPVNTFPESNFLLEIPAKHTVFIDGKLWKAIQKDTSFVFPVKSLMREFGKDSVQISILSMEAEKNILPVRIVKGVSFETASTKNLEKTFFPKINRFKISSLKDFCFISLMVILFFLAAYRMAYPYLIGQLLHPVTLLNSEDFSENGGLQKGFSIDVLLFLFITSLILGQIFVIGLFIFEHETIEMWIDWYFSSFLMLWIGLSFLFFFMFSLKFSFIRLFGFLFEMGKSDFGHFFYLFRLTFLGVSLISLLSLFLIVNDFEFFETVFSSFVAGFFWIYLFGILGLFLIMMNRFSFKKYHLFTYLCIVEIVPFIILSKGIMVLGQ